MNWKNSDMIIANPPRQCKRRKKERGALARPSSVFGFYSIFTVYHTASTNSSTAAPQIT